MPLSNCPEPLACRPPLMPTVAPLPDPLTLIEDDRICPSNWPSLDACTLVGISRVPPPLPARLLLTFRLPVMVPPDMGRALLAVVCALFAVVLIVPITGTRALTRASVATAL